MIKTIVVKQTGVHESRTGREQHVEVELHAEVSEGDDPLKEAEALQAHSDAMIMSHIAALEARDVLEHGAGAVEADESKIKTGTEYAQLQGGSAREWFDRRILSAARPMLQTTQEMANKQLADQLAPQMAQAQGGIMASQAQQEKGKILFRRMEQGGFLGRKAKKRAANK